MRQHRWVERDRIVDRRFDVQLHGDLLSLCVQDTRPRPQYRRIACPLAIASTSRSISRLIISLLAARCFRVKNRWPRWTFFRRIKSNVNLIIAARMDEANANILDYFLLPTDKFAGQRKVDLTETSCTSLEPYRGTTVDGLVHSIFNALARHGGRR